MSLGSLHGLMNRECINGTHPIMVAAQRSNFDVQLPYRCFPLIKECHCRRHSGCLINTKVVIEATHMAQDAQAGYACDDCTQRQPMAFN